MIKFLCESVGEKYYNALTVSGHYFFNSWFTDFLTGKTGRSVEKKIKILKIII